jgi:hypothetical protein
MSSQQLTYDDRDSAFQYTGGWFLDGTWSASNGQSGTLSGTNDNNGYVTFVRSHSLQDLLLRDLME